MWAWIPGPSTTACWTRRLDRHPRPARAPAGDLPGGRSRGQCPGTLLAHPSADGKLEIQPSARAINVTGGNPGRIHLDNLQAERSFRGLDTYSHTKPIQMALSYEFAQRLQGTSVTVNVCYPGRASTAMTQNVTPEMLRAQLRVLWPLFKLMFRADQGQSAAKAARSSIYLAASPDVQGVTGQYIDSECQRADWPAAVLDPHVRRHLWAVAEQLTHWVAQGA